MPQVPPKHIYLNTTPVQVRNWRHDSDGISFRATFRGSRAAEEFESLTGKPIPISWDEVPAYTGDARVVQHSVTGDGPTAVHLLHVELSPPPAPEDDPETTLSPEEQLASLRNEVAALRQEVAQLRLAVMARPQPAGGSPYSPGLRTLIEDDIDTTGN